jgi:hypothetical protein
MREAAKKTRENAAATRRRRRSPGANKFMTRVVTTSTVNTPMQYSV